eukprot:TRINITY_DN7757_c0_g1_i1.p1 TRINITY_DN7757_c0_g1~~TRINITY_DN7757_c0_g1_i1.p1  ORF type:complete len:146 (+),score=41.01 TRINITY_DN7757_c0_g1_i1:40-477(+)
MNSRVARAFGMGNKKEDEEDGKAEDLDLGLNEKADPSIPAQGTVKKETMRIEANLQPQEAGTEQLEALPHTMHQEAEQIDCGGMEALQDDGMCAPGASRGNVFASLEEALAFMETRTYGAPLPAQRITRGPQLPQMRVSRATVHY